MQVSSDEFKGRREAEGGEEVGAAVSVVVVVAASRICAPAAVSGNARTPLPAPTT